MSKVLFAILALGLVGSAVGAQNAKSSKAASVSVAERQAALVAQTKERIKQIDTVLARLKEAQSPVAEKGKVDAEHAAWLKSVQARFEAQKQKMQFGSTSGLNGGDMVEKMAQANLDFLALQTAVQNESRKFNTLSNASKSRHEALLNAVRNLK